MTSTGGSHDSARLHLGPVDEDAVDVELPSAEEQLAAHNEAYVEPDRSEWVTCIPACHWADDGSDPASGRMTPRAEHAEGCPHAGSKYIEFIPAPVGG